MSLIKTMENVKPAREFQIGDLIENEFGQMSEVLSVRFSRSGKSRIFRLRSLDSGDEYVRRFLAYKTLRFGVIEDGSE